MNHAEPTVHLVVDAWTVGPLRTALADVSDDVLLQVWVAEEPGRDVVDEQVVVGVHLTSPPPAAGRERIDPVLRLECEFASGTYVRGSR